ncbi:PASTA domain-containing protein [Catellatospora coxensis]|uniref:PASTA domain-containing protein n=1 Tax=Catellatospora coxensis TaxID=310354 RepID=A0A8J3KQW5_9ACTN|nr:PASTA domain-containing protein [Catellatospora coxensis]GIG05540.1 hypothetical protein Cco03nite_22400 [Catellatospora coxensis]
MSDEQRHDDNDPAARGNGPGSSPSDETAPMAAHRRDDEPRPGDEPTTVLPSGGQGADEATTVLPTGGRPGDEATTVFPAGGRPGDEATTVLPAGGPVPVPPGGEPTSVLPPVGGRPAPPDERTSVMPAQDVWMGRAGVPTPEPRPMRDATPPPGIEYGEGQRTWRAPLIIIGIALLLLALFAVAAWFVLRGTGPTPTPTVSPTPALTTAAPTSAAPSPAESVSPSPEVSAVPVPENLVGLSQQEAIDALNAVGLNPRISVRITGDADPGTVVDVEPEAGTLLEPGSTVTIVVASAPTSPSPEPSPSAEASPSPDGDGD